MDEDFKNDYLDFPRVPIGIVKSERIPKENVVIFWYMGIPIVTRFPDDRMLVTTDKQRREDQRRALNFVLTPDYKIDEYWHVHHKSGMNQPFSDGGLLRVKSCLQGKMHV